MGNSYSKNYKWAATEVGIGTASYSFIFWKLFRKYREAGIAPNDCLSIATNTISSINCLIGLAAFATFFTDKRWENPIIDDPKLAGHLVPLVWTYMLVDVVAHFICYALFNKQDIPRRPDIIIHHFISLIVYPLMLIPKPIYYWFLYTLLLGVETSTVFLNLQWFAKHFKWKKKIRGFMKFCFLMTWYGVRMPIIVVSIWWMIKYWKDILETPKYKAMGIITLNTIHVILQVVWSIVLFVKVIAYFKPRYDKKQPIMLKSHWKQQKQFN
eukprot:413733_1